MTYYLKYRPQKLSDLDCVSVRETLEKILFSKTIPHAFLFAGPKGTGKTSAARIVAKILNCESTSKFKPCNKCGQCISITQGNNVDVVEIDAASHRGVEEIREIVASIKLATISSKKKVYIIDEAHMLTVEACNALLKTLEEPPSHVVFIFATTNSEKIIPTIKSRTSEIRFNKAGPDEISASIKKIVKGEKLKVTPETLDLIAQRSGGSFRDSHKILETLVSQKSLGVENAKKVLSLGDIDNISTVVLNAVLERDFKKILSTLSLSVNRGVSVLDIIEKLLKRIKDSYTAKLTNGKDDHPDFLLEEEIDFMELMLSAYQKTKGAIIEEIPLEIALIKWCVEHPISGQGNNEEKVLDKEVGEISEANTVSAEGMVDVFQNSWSEILQKVKIHNVSVEALLRASKPLFFDGDVLKIGVYYKFHKEKLEELRNRRIIEEVISTVVSKTVKVICLLTETSSLTADKKEDIMDIAKRIFN